MRLESRNQIHSLKLINDMKQDICLFLNHKITAFGLVIGLCCCLHTEGVAQVAINTDGSNPSSNMILDLNPAVGKAFAPPKMNWAQIKAITPATTGMVVYDTEFNCLRIYNGTKWACSNDRVDLFAPSGSFTTQTASGSPEGIATDASGNVYVTGYFSGTATFGALPPINSIGFSDIFIVKYNNLGVAQWVQKAGGTSFTTAQKIAVDASGNVYVTGYFAGTATFGALSPIVSVGGVVYDIFIAKYNSSGTAQWVQKAGGTGADYGSGIALDASNNVFITGFFNGTATFGALPPIVSAGGQDIFVAKYNSSGTAQWVKQAGGLGTDQGYSIALDALGDVYVSGSFYNVATFGTLSPITSAGVSDVFVARLASSDGFFTWVKRGGGTGTDYNYGIVVDALNNLYITGFFNNTATFGALSPIVSAGSTDIYITKYNSGGIEQWVQRYGGVDSESGNSIALDALNNIYITGYFVNTTTFGALSPITSKGFTDSFIAKFNASGGERWIQTGGGANGDSGSGIAVDVLGNVYTTGTFSPSAQFGNQILTSGYMFLMKYSE
jgi:Beta-propeller repeat